MMENQLDVDFDIYYFSFNLAIKLLMKTNKKPLLSLPKIKDDYLHIPKILAHQIQPINT